MCDDVQDDVERDGERGRVFPGIHDGAPVQRGRFIEDMVERPCASLGGYEQETCEKIGRGRTSRTRRVREYRVKHVVEIRLDFGHCG